MLVSPMHFHMYLQISPSLADVRAEGEETAVKSQSQTPGKCCCSRPMATRNEAATPGAPVADPSVWKAPWVIGRLPSAAGDVPQVATSLAWADRLGGWKVRWRIGRMQYRIAPGIYGAGNPNEESPVLVTANYKLTFDALRSELHGRDAWILVLDTKGVNVWCAAAKGTFSAEELVRRIGATNLPALVSHNVLIVPQLGAVGVTAREVHAASGFRVVFGPVYAADLPRFLESGIKSPDMHTVRFSTTDRLVLVPAELGSWTMKALLVAACLVLLAGFGPEGFSTGGMMTMGAASALLCLAATVSAVVLGPALLPWLPGRAFAVKGMWLGLLLAAVLVVLSSVYRASALGVVDLVAWCLAIPAISSFITMGFTGATPYTSVSGVRREMRTALPLQIAAAAGALVAWVAARFV